MTRESQITKLERESATGVLVAYRLMLSSLFVGTLICILVVGVPAGFLAYGIAQGKHYDIPVQLFVLLLGSLGAFFSALMRLYSFEHLPKALLEDGLKGLANWHLVIYSLVPPVISPTINALPDHIIHLNDAANICHAIACISLSQ